MKKVKSLKRGDRESFEELPKKAKNLNTQPIPSLKVEGNMADDGPNLL